MSTQAVAPRRSGHPRGRAGGRRARARSSQAMIDRRSRGSGPDGAAPAGPPRAPPPAPQRAARQPPLAAGAQAADRRRGGRAAGAASTTR